MTYEYARACLFHLLQLGEHEMTRDQCRRFNELNEVVWRNTQQIEPITRWLIAQWETVGA